MAINKPYRNKYSKYCEVCNVEISNAEKPYSTEDFSDKIVFCSKECAIASYHAGVIWEALENASTELANKLNKKE
ncbi:hypothetical protein GOV05_00590 [Candidatus Woesearchaeota archaeon]|nr:hypothetical protein [Candidatus Woesearchaeota archaeon]